MPLAELEDERWMHRGDRILQWHKLAAKHVVDGSVLDVGGGNGSFAAYLHDRGVEDVSLVDISPIGMERAKSLGFEAHVADLASPPLPFEDDSFDTVTLIEVLEHLYDPISTLLDCKRIARKKIILSVPNFGYAKFRLQHMTGKIPTVLRHKNRHVYWFDESSLGSVMDAAGLPNYSVEYVTPNRILPRSWWSYMARMRPSLVAVDFVVRVELDGAGSNF